MQSLAARSFWTVVAVFIAGAASVVSWGLHDPGEIHGPNDPSYYWRMANGEVVSAPFGCRFLLPAIVRAAPVDNHVGFVVVTALLVGLAAGGWRARPLARDVSVVMAIVPALAWHRERDADALIARAVTVVSFVAVRGRIPVTAAGNSSGSWTCARAEASWAT